MQESAGQYPAWEQPVFTAGSFVYPMIRNMKSLSSCLPYKYILKMRKKVLYMLVSIFMVVGTLSLSGESEPLAGEQQPAVQQFGFRDTLFIPPILTADPATGRIDLEISEGKTEFIPGVYTDTLGYNGALLGPTIVTERGEELKFSIHNTLAEDTTVHWHGAHVPAKMDGGPFQVITAGDYWNPEFVVNQQAATLWYHPHLMGRTAEHVYRGLAGFLVIKDAVSESLAIPQEYGINDIPLVFQDRRFNSDGTFSYSPAMPDVMHGYFGNAMLVNGSIEPLLRVEESLVRFRILNGSNSTIMRYRFSDGMGFYQIASDGGFLEEPVPMDKLILSPGERAEILVDFTQAAPEDVPVLVADTSNGRQFAGVAFALDGMRASKYHIPERLVDIPDVNIADASVRRPFVMATGMGGRMTINGRQMSMQRVDEVVQLGAVEVWEVVNAGMGMMTTPHSFHVHDIQFRVFSINGQPPLPNQRGWKDTVLLWPGDEVRLLVSFEDYTGKYMYHCHLLEHEDQGMMGVFEVVE